MTNNNLILRGSESYELLDSGDGRKLERFGKYFLIRPEKQAIWKPSNPTLWSKADVEYIRSNEKYGEWNIRNNSIPNEWIFEYDILRLKIKLTPFGHVGVFPEQELQWDWIAKQCHADRKLNVLSLFSYTGGATLAAAACDANVVHVDASKPAITWATENQKLSGLENKQIRWIADDALKFVKREERRGNKYDGIVMDPPKFGRGPKGEVWQFEKDFLELVESCTKILSNNPAFFLVTAYTVPVSPVSLGNVLSDFLDKDKIEFGEVMISGSSGKNLPTSMYARFAST